MKKLLLLITFVFFKQLNAQVCFNVLSNSASGTNSVISGDFNKDGFIDIAATEAPSNEVIVGINSGTATFTYSFFPVGTDPESVTSADFNGDGNLDLAVANSNQSETGVSNLCVLLGTGTGSFGTATYFGTGVTPQAITSADFNNDGKADLAVANYDSYDVNILLGTGTGSFGATASIAIMPLSVPSSAESITSADFNGDGNMDLAAGLGGRNEIVVLLGDGTGNFGNKTFFPGGGGFATIHADFNADGKADLASVYDESADIFLGTGTGSFAPATSYVTDTSSWGITSGDLMAMEYWI